MIGSWEGFRGWTVLPIFHVGVFISVSNLLNSWWALPWGPIYTIQSVVINLSARESISMSELARRGSASEGRLRSGAAYSQIRMNPRVPMISTILSRSGFR